MVVGCRATLAEGHSPTNPGRPCVSTSKPDPARRASAETRAVHGPDGTHTGPSGTPIVHSTTWGFESLEAMNAEQAKGPGGAFYQRYGHPTLAAVERRFADLEGADAALLFSSGMAAISCTFLAFLQSGDHAVALEQSYGGTPELLAWGAERLGWSYTLVDAREPDTWEAAFRPGTRLFHVESPTNPTLCIVDLRAAAALAHRHGARLTVDNTFASPLGQAPLALGADLVVYSATKSLGGHGDLLAGVAAGPADAMKQVWHARKLFGPVPDPGLAWQLERSLKTLPLRLAAMNDNARELASRLAQHPGVARVYYPGLAAHPGHDVAARQMTRGFGHVVAVDLAAGAAGAEALVHGLRLIRHGPSLGGVDSLASLPSHTSHVALGPAGRARVGIPEGLVRFSVGVEAVDDLWADVEQALAGVPAAARRS